jgi:hypothetical protein
MANLCNNCKNLNRVVTIEDSMHTTFSSLLTEHQQNDEPSFSQSHSAATAKAPRDVRRPPAARPRPRVRTRQQHTASPPRPAATARIAPRA